MYAESWLVLGGKVRKCAVDKGVFRFFYSFDFSGGTGKTEYLDFLAFLIFDGELNDNKRRIL